MYDKELLKEMWEVPEISKALELSKEGVYTKEELEAYDRYWDSVHVQKAYISDAKLKGRAEGIQIGKEKTKRQSFVLPIKSSIT